ncbi:hypothetical protein GQ43DRAFT_247276 [Delitschia confertaspora ATCC 74209]|uniref:Vint domain-containing protein n=1 Tax=Delitschia confertaspora ATCC 74209 TaxID=1513339 RepID=A0A9P4MR55_9PLEO|nr:hypothetical protein GQ43DRAFT_247276 [Delitschia confertaspora ATCC 74209]
MPIWWEEWCKKKRAGFTYGPSQGVDGCFGGSSVVHLPDGTAKPVKSIKKGDIVLCKVTGATATVRCVLELHVPAGLKRMASFGNGLIITGMHPILWDGEWVLPREVIEEEEIEIEKVFNFILDGEDTLIVNGVTCSVVGHQGARVVHPFWGNKDRVVECMESVDKKGFHSGVVEIVGMIRDEFGTVYGFQSLDGRRIIGQCNKGVN